MSSGDWVGIGFGSNMKKHDMFYVSQNTFHDAWSTSDSIPSDDNDQTDYQFTGSAGTYEITRPLKPKDTSQDEEIKVDEGV